MQIRAVSYTTRFFSFDFDTQEVTINEEQLAVWKEDWVQYYFIQHKHITPVKIGAEFYLVDDSYTVLHEEGIRRQIGLPLENGPGTSMLGDCTFREVYEKILAILAPRLGIRIPEVERQKDTFMEEELTLLLEYLSNNVNYYNAPVGTQIIVSVGDDRYCIHANRSLRLLSNPDVEAIAKRHNMKIPCDGIMGEDYTLSNVRLFPHRYRSLEKLHSGRQCICVSSSFEVESMSLIHPMGTYPLVSYYVIYVDRIVRIGEKIDPCTAPTIPMCHIPSRLSPNVKIHIISK